LQQFVIWHAEEILSSSAAMCVAEALSYLAVIFHIAYNTLSHTNISEKTHEVTRY